MLVEVSAPERTVKRICFYVLRDRMALDQLTKQSIAALKEHCQRLILLCAHPLTEVEREALEETDVEVFESQSKGIVAQLVEALRCFEQDISRNADWLLVTGDWLLGPIRPLQPVFRRMEQDETDFWGLTSCRTLLSKDGKAFRTVEPYLQGYFYAFGTRMLDGSLLREYWEGRLAGEALFEEKTAEAFTRYFTSRSFRWKALAPAGEDEKNSINPMLFEPVRLIRDKGCPFFHVECFSTSYNTMWTHSIGDQGRKLLRFLEEEGFDTDLLWQRLLLSCHLSEIHRNLGLLRVLPETNSAVQIPRQRTALILHLHYTELFAQYYQYALAMPSGSDLFITTTSEERRAEIQDLFASEHWRRLEVRVIPNRGRDVAALLAGCADVVKDYDCLCFAHDKRSHSGEAKTHGFGFSEHCMQNILGSQELVSQVLERFDREPRLGLLFPPPPCHGGFVKSIENEWTNNYDATSKLAGQVGMTVPMDEEHEPIAPLGTMFWFRASALQALFDQGWTYQDFPGEPNDSDGTLLHAIERLYPFVAQQAGFYSAWCLSQSYADRYMLNLYQTAQFSQRTLYEGGLLRLILLRLKRSFKRHLPKALWKRMRSMYFALADGRGTGRA